jgi:hypothetical protein
MFAKPQAVARAGKAVDDVRHNMMVLLDKSEVNNTFYESVGKIGRGAAIR